MATRMHIINRIFTMLFIAILLVPCGALAQDSSTQTRNVVVGAIDMPPVAMKDDAGQWIGLAMNLWRNAAREMDIDFEVREFDSIEAILAAVKKREIDVIPTAIVSRVNEVNVDFTNHYHRSGSAIAVRAERSGIGWVQQAKRILTWQFMAAIGSLLLLWAIAGTLVWVFEGRRNREMFGGGPLGGLGQGIWWAAVTMTTVGYGDKAPKTPGGRIVAIIWMFASIVLISSFTATITTSLTLSELKGKVTGYSDLPVVRVGVLALSRGEQYLSSKGIGVKGFRSLREGMQALVDDKIDAFVHDEYVLKYMAKNIFPARVHVLPETFDHYYLSMAIPQGHQLREPLNRALLKVMGTADWEKSVSRYLGK
jgi:ABC-type amino acid transport substrate-binding protein